MSTYKNIISQLEDLISSASKANTEAISETTKFISQLDRSKLNMDTFREVEQKLISETLVSVTKLNIRYITELIQLSVALTRRLNENSSAAASTQQAAPQKASVSAFEIKTSATAGETATAAFLLNSDKNEPIICEVTNTAFYSTAGTNAGFETPVSYSPQAFELIKGNAQRVDVFIPVPADVPSDVYKSMISVKGFEHAHFDLLLQVTAPIRNEEPVVKSATKARTKKAPVAAKAAKKTVKASPAKKAKK